MEAGVTEMRTGERGLFVKELTACFVPPLRLLLIRLDRYRFLTTPLANSLAISTLHPSRP